MCSSPKAPKPLPVEEPPKADPFVTAEDPKSEETRKRKRKISGMSPLHIQNKGTGVKT